METIDYSSNTLSFSDLTARLAYLEERHKYGQPEADAPDETWDGWHEYETLRDLVDELHWCDASTTLVNVSFWVEYCQEFCYDIGEVRKDGMVDHLVDWDKVADSMLMDWKAVQLPDGNDFYVRG